MRVFSLCVALVLTACSSQGRTVAQQSANFAVEKLNNIHANIERNLAKKIAGNLPNMQIDKIDECFTVYDFHLALKKERISRGEEVAENAMKGLRVMRYSWQIKLQEATAAGVAPTRKGELYDAIYDPNGNADEDIKTFERYRDNCEKIAEVAYEKLEE